jgi:hypothetical protein
VNIPFGLQKQMICNTGEKDNDGNSVVCGPTNPDRKNRINVGVNVDFRDYAVLVGEIVDLMNNTRDDQQIDQGRYG